MRRQRTAEEYQAAVRSAVEEIRAGEAFQIVVSQRFEVDTTADALDIYRVLRLTNPSPYMYLLRLEDSRGRGFDIVGSSPEALVTVKDGVAVTHPIAGSKARGGTPAEDAALEAELLSDPKERAEHLMLVDLGRNDLGRVCETGTVEVVEFMDVRRYSHIMHLESTVQGRVDADHSALDRGARRLPAGTLSGAPKVALMEIIDELEVSRRALYGGVVGYLDFAGDADAAIAIRTALLRDGVAYVPGRWRDRRRLRPGDRGPGVPEQGRRRGPCDLGGPDLLAAGFDALMASPLASSGPLVSKGARRSQTYALAGFVVGAALGLVAGSQPWWRAEAAGLDASFSGTESTGGISQALAFVVAAGALLL